MQCSNRGHRTVSMLQSSTCYWQVCALDSHTRPGLPARNSASVLGRTADVSPVVVSCTTVSLLMHDSLGGGSGSMNVVSASNPLFSRLVGVSTW